MKNQKLQSFIQFCLVWLCVGFPMGLWVLLAGPSKWLSEYALRTRMTLSDENLLGKLIILAYVVVSFVIALFLFRLIKRSKQKLLAWFVSVLLGLLLISSVLIFSFRPHWLIVYSGSSDGSLTRSGTDKLEFVFGPYPDEARLDSLKDRRFDGVISLLHEMVVPAEPTLLRKETDYGEKIGLEVKNIPMLPWISGNEKSLEEIKKLLDTGRGLYYVHCYLGRDRVNVFKSLVEKYGAETEIQKIGAIRRIEEMPQMERGKYYKLEENVCLTPFPTDEEFFSYVLNGYFRTVISMLDSSLVENSEWVRKEKEVMAAYGMNYIHWQPNFNFGEADLAVLKTIINEKEKPILIHGFRTDDPMSQFIIANY